jgi:hypothetical protein
VESLPDFVMTRADGTRLNRATYLKDLERGTTTFAPVPDPEYKVLVYGQTAVHLGEANRMSTGSDGGSILVHVVWTDTWVRTSDAGGSPGGAGGGGAGQVALQLSGPPARSGTRP